MLSIVEEGAAMRDKAPFCYVNGKRHELPCKSAELTLLEYLRGLRCLQAADLLSDLKQLA